MTVRLSLLLITFWFVVVWIWLGAAVLAVVDSRFDDALAYVLWGAVTFTLPVALMGRGRA